LIESATTIIQLAVGLVFLYAGVSKALRPYEFIRGLQEFGLTGELFSHVLGFGLIALELGVAASHLLGYGLLEMACAGGAFLVALCFVIVRALRRGETIDCMCFGTTRIESVSSRTAFRLFILLAAECVVIFVSAGLSAEEPLTRLGMVDWSLAMLSAGLCVLLASAVIDAQEVFKFGKR
jgi:hypothetical protein